jgi:DNA-binding NarL/FixJ family response regulator
MNGKKIKVFLADDHPVVRSGLKTEFEKNKTIEIIGEASSGRETIEKVAELNPDVILMDISMPDMNGLEATEIIIKKNPEAKIIALSIHDNENYVREIIRLGAIGYVMKDAHPEELIKAIESVTRGQPYYSSRLVETVFKQHAEMMRKSKKSFKEDQLTMREKEILKLLAEGCTNKQIADKLFLSVRTIETHRENIMKKLNIKNAAGLIKYAIQIGLVKV